MFGVIVMAFGCLQANLLNMTQIGGGTIGREYDNAWLKLSHSQADEMLQYADFNDTD